MLDNDAAIYLETLVHQIAPPHAEGEIPLHDLFPAVQSFYDERDGLLNKISFRSDNRVRMNVGFRYDSDYDYRDHIYHQGGVAYGAEVEPFRVAISWREGRWADDWPTPYVLLPGTSRMLHGTPLHYMEFPGYMTWSPMMFAIKRVWRHAGVT